MKRLLAWVEGFILMSAAVVCSVGAPVLAFSFDVDIPTVLLIWLLAALASSALASVWRGVGLFALVIFIPAAVVRMLPEITAGARGAASFITGEYNKWLHVPALFPGAEASSYELTLFFAAAGAVLAFLLAFSMCLRRSVSLTILLTLLPVLLTFVLIDYPPDPRLLFGLLAVYLTLLISSSLYPQDLIKSYVAAFPSLVIAVALLGAAYALAPPEKYSEPGELMNLLNQSLTSMFRREDAAAPDGAGWPGGTGAGWRFNTRKVDIAGAGRRTLTGQSILEITSPQAGTFYLRGYSMQRFDGGSWHGGGESPEADGIPADIIRRYAEAYPGLPDFEEAIMTVSKTGELSDMSYLPYYTASHTNTEPDVIGFFYLRESLLGLAGAVGVEIYDLSSYTRNAQRVYTQIDASTAEGLRELAAGAGISAGDDRRTVAYRVAEYVSSGGRYTLSPPVIPEDEDFALYFLQTSREGYCIHFATAATLMLRALGIPARFTSGFVAAVSPEDAGRPITLTDRQAHAWVEVYYDGIGWLPLEVTPAAAGLGLAGDAPDDADTAPPEQSPQNTPAPAESEAPATSPGAQTPGGPVVPAERGGSARGGHIAAAGLILAAACVLSLVLRRYFARKKWNRGFNQADTNAAALCVWRYITRLDRHNGPPEEIEALALKARFSVHRISEDERALMTGYAKNLSREVFSRRNPFGRFWLRYIRGL